jgi:ligand-binding SRPBCC domain-containing protein
MEMVWDFHEQLQYEFLNLYFCEMKLNKSYTEMVWDFHELIERVSLNSAFCQMQ